MKEAGIDHSILSIPTPHIHNGDEAGVKHWHGAAPDSWFSHLAIEVAGEDTGSQWLEPVDDENYMKLK